MCPVILSASRFCCEHGDDEGFVGHYFFFRHFVIK